jgi:hypothetical protein
MHSVLLSRVPAVAIVAVPKLWEFHRGEASKIQAVLAALILSCGFCFGSSECCSGGATILVVK